MEFLTCLNGHRSARSEWQESAFDHTTLLCPKCGHLTDDSKPTRRMHDCDLDADIRTVPPGRRAIHVSSLITTLDLWMKARGQAGLDSKPLRKAIEMLSEYRDMLAANDIDLACGVQLDRLLDPLPRESGETDADYRERGKRGMVAEYAERRKPPPTLAPGKGAIVWRP